MTAIVIVGAGQAGASLAIRLRALGHRGPITIIGEEHALPYERPPLSKAYLLGKLDRERLYLRPGAFYAEHDISVVTGARVEGIDRQRGSVFAGGTWYDYDLLALTTGSFARRLPAELGGDLAGTFVVRTLSDVDAMAKECTRGSRAVVVGGGYIGLEAAAVFSALAMQVTVVEMAPRILQRVAATQTSDYFRALHVQHGVQFREACGLKTLKGGERVTSAVLADGSEVECDLAIVGIGVVPAVAVAADAGLTIDDGIAVDANGRTSDPAIWAAGDCASFPFKGKCVRLESVQNACDQATLVAENMLGADKTYSPVPWFWSDQYDVKLQIAGLHSGYDRVVVRPGTKAGAVSHWYYAGDEIVAVDAMNDPRSYMLGKRMLECGICPDPAAVADPNVNLKALLPA